MNGKAPSLLIRHSPAERWGSWPSFFQQLDIMKFADLQSAIPSSAGNDCHLQKLVLKVVISGRDFGFEA